MYYWLGVNSFTDAAYRPEIVNAPHPRNTLLHSVYTSVIEDCFSEDDMEPHGKEVLAEAIADGLITKDGKDYKPNFLVFTQEQLDKLREAVYRPLMESIEPTIVVFGKQISEMHMANFPKINKPYVDYHTYLDLWDFGIYTLMYAALDGKLYIPDRPELGTPLTLVIVK